MISAGGFYLRDKIAGAQSVTNPLGAGWIKFNSDSVNGSPASPVNYSVQIHQPDGSGNALISGAAWSSNYGWLSFNGADLAGCPTAPCTASVNLNSGAVSGWAKFLLADEDPSDSWDGWVSLSGESTVTSASLINLNKIASLLESFLSFSSRR